MFLIVIIIFPEWETHATWEDHRIVVVEEVLSTLFPEQDCSLAQFYNTSEEQMNSDGDHCFKAVTRL